MKKVLIVDDDRTMRETLADVFRDEGHAVRTAADGLEGLRQLQTDRPDLLLVDNNMPGLTGLKILRTIYGTMAGTEVVLMSGQLDSNTAQTAYALGAKSCLQKPFNCDVLLDLLAESSHTRAA